MENCTYGAETVCRDGTACLPVTGSSTGACYLGGSVAIGSACANSFDCTRTGVCVDFPVGGSRCVEGCNLDGTHPCNGGMVCVNEGTFGYCGASM